MAPVFPLRNQASWLLSGFLLLTVISCQKVVTIPPLVTLQNLAVDQLQDQVLTDQRRITATDIGDPQKRGSMAMALEANGLHRLAISEYQAAQRLDPADALWPYRAAIARLAIGETERAIEDLNKVTDRFPDFSPAWHRLAMARLEIADDTGAEHAIGQLLDLVPESIRGRAGYAEILLNTGDAPGALEILKTVTQQDRRNEWAFRLLGQTYLRLGQSGTVVEGMLRNTLDAERLYQQDPREDQLTRFRTGRDHENKFCAKLIRQSRFDIARERLLRTLQTHPEDVQFRSLLAQAHQGEGNTSAALKELDTIIRHDAELIGAYILKVNFSIQEGDRLARSGKSSTDEILSHYQRAAASGTAAITQAPDNWQAHFARARAEIKLSNDAAARLHLAKARQLEPNSSEVCLVLFDVCLRLADRDLAATTIQAVTEMDPGNLDAWVKLGLFHVSEGNLEQAHKALQKSAQINPIHPAVQTLRSRVSSLQSKNKDS